MFGSRSYCTAAIDSIVQLAYQTRLLMEARGIYNYPNRGIDNAHQTAKA
jgi:hypothetical protein